jgi:hypothetical protein
MVKPVMKVIRENHNTGCYSPPALKKSCLEIYERRGQHKKMMEITLTMDFETIERRNFSVFHVTFPFVHERNSTL